MTFCRQSIGDSLWESVAFVQQSADAAWAAAGVCTCVRVNVSYELCMCVCRPHASRAILDTRFKCSTPPCAFMHRTGFENEEAVVAHSGEFTSDDLIAFINTNKLRSYAPVYLPVCRVAFRSVLLSVFFCNILISYGRLTQENRAMVHPALIHAHGSGIKFIAQVQAFFETKKDLKIIVCIRDGAADDLSVAAAAPAAIKALGLGRCFSPAATHGNHANVPKKCFAFNVSPYSGSNVFRQRVRRSRGQRVWARPEPFRSRRSERCSVYCRLVSRFFFL